jgi:hypothetical protein
MKKSIRFLLYCGSLLLIMSTTSCINQSYITHGYQPVLMDSARQTKMIIGGSPRLLKVGLAHSFKHNFVLSTINDFNRYYIDTKLYGLYCKNFDRLKIETGLGLGYIGNNTNYKERYDFIHIGLDRLKIPKHANAFLNISYTYLF